jgi:hypothetical protein
MREIRLSGSEGGGDELNRLSLPLSSSPNNNWGRQVGPRRRRGHCTLRRGPREL